MVYMDKSMISTAIIPIASQFHFSSGQTGLMMSLFFLGYSLMQIPSGWLADRFGSKRVLMASLFIIACFSYLFGIANGLLFFIVVRFCAGVGHGGYPPSGSKAIAENFPKDRRTFVQSLILSTSGIGGILAFTLGAQLVDMNWHYAYIAMGTLFLVALLFVWRFVPKGQDGNRKASDQTEKTSFLAILKNRNVFVLFLAMLLLNVLLYGNMSWLPSYITSTFNLSISQAGMILAINAVFQTIATIFAGQLLSKLFLHKEKRVILIATLMVAALLVGFVLSSNLYISVVLLLLISMISVTAFTAIFTWPHKIMDANIIGSSIGIINTGGTLGGFLAPMVIGFLVQAAGGSFVPAFLFMAVMSLLCGMTVIAVKTKA
ncbi:major facilitator family transporter [Lacticaseibacillus paracasei NRIC 1981]|nr:major facilitator family transporter [Lacticaseibacillus paracasei NRIC 1981]